MNVEGLLILSHLVGEKVRSEGLHLLSYTLQLYKIIVSANQITPMRAYKPI